MSPALLPRSISPGSSGRSSAKAPSGGPLFPVARLLLLRSACEAPSAREGVFANQHPMEGVFPSNYRFPSFAAGTLRRHQRGHHQRGHHQSGHQRGQHLRRHLRRHQRGQHQRGQDGRGDAQRGFGMASEPALVIRLPHTRGRRARTRSKFVSYCRDRGQVRRWVHRFARGSENYPIAKLVRGRFLGGCGGSVGSWVFKWRVNRQHVNR